MNFRGCFEVVTTKFSIKYVPETMISMREYVAKWEEILVVVLEEKHITLLVFTLSE